jgi:quercetin dioxygenase-like cupin family protein
MNTDDYFIKQGGGSRHPLFPGVVAHTTTGQGMTLSVVHFEADSVVPEHAHPHEQMGVMLSGSLTFHVGGVTRILGPGDQWRIPGGIPHRVEATHGPAVALDAFHPVREDYR